MILADINFKPIGILHSEHVTSENTPAQPVYAEDCFGVAEIYPSYASGLKDLEAFSHLYLIYHLHQAEEAKLTVQPFLHDDDHGIFATRAPCRPNAIGLSIVELVKREDNVLHLKGIDILDGTPILDIKPYSAKFDHIVATRNGWLDEVDEDTARQRGKRGYVREENSRNHQIDGY